MAVVESELEMLSDAMEQVAKKISLRTKNFKIDRDAFGFYQNGCV